MPDSETLIHVNAWNVSPKLVSAGDKESGEKSYSALYEFLRCISSWTDAWQLKFVIADDADLKRMNFLLEKLHLICGLTAGMARKHVYVMPECTTREQHLQKQSWLIQKVIEDGRVNFCPRLHVLAWNDRKGV